MTSISWVREGREGGWMLFKDTLDAGVKHSNGPLKEVCERLLSHIVNVRAISTHFVPKIDHWCTANEIASITPDQVGVVTALHSTLSHALHCRFWMS